MIAALAAAAIASGCAYDLGRSPRARDVVVIVVDGLRADRVSALAARHAQCASSPEVDVLASQGVVYARATAPATWCVPAYGSLLTGRWPSFHGAERLGDGERVNARDLDQDATTLAEVLGGAGFRTAAFAEAETGLVVHPGLARGFESVSVRDDGAGLAKAVGVWLARHTEPSFLFVAIGGLDPLGEDSQAVGGAIGSPAAAATAAKEAYDREARSADRKVGEVLAALRASGRYDGALVVVTADHGKLLGEHGLVADGRPPFEPQVHVPLVVKHAGGRRSGEWVDRRVSTLGVFATVAEAAGVAVPAGTQAKPLDDLHPVWVEEVDVAGTRLRAGYDGPNLKVISLTDGRDAVVCSFDLAADPGELRPRCDADAAPVLRAALASFGGRARPPRQQASLATADERAAEPGTAAN